MSSRYLTNVLLACAGIAVCSSAVGDDRPCVEQMKRIDEMTTTALEIAQRAKAIDCLQRFIDEGVTDVRSIATRVATNQESPELPELENSIAPSLVTLASLKEAQVKEENTRDFKDFSMGTGMAILREPSLDGSNDAVPIVEFHWLVKTWGGEENAGLGFFGAFNAGAKDSNAIDHIGGGVLLSARFDETIHPINFGVGYMIDRKGFESEDKAVRGDRSGLFYMLSFNPISAAKFIGGFFVEKK